jgi:starvation-inducible outer membrane lipoprotein
MNTKALLCAALVLLMSACSAHPKRVDCETHLTPINPPAHLTGSTAQP